MTLEPLFNDGFDGQSSKRVLQYIESAKKNNKPVAGIYCGYAPIELIQSMGMVPAILCAFSSTSIPTAETILPAQLCPLIKSSYGFILEGNCPFFALSDVVIAETTCDGKKKMFELISDIKPMFVMDLPQIPQQKEALDNWVVMIQKLRGFLEDTFKLKTSDEKIEQALKDSNKKNKAMQKIFEYAALKPSVIIWQEMYDIGRLASCASWKELKPLFEKLIKKLKKRVCQGLYAGKPDSPRVLVTGCPIDGDAAKIFKIIEEIGGVVVAPDSCSGMKCFMGEFEEETGHPVTAIAKRYLEIPCACMTPNEARLNALSMIIEKFKPDVVIDFILQTCHSYNVESYKTGKHITEKHNLPFLKIESDYYDGDNAQIKTRIEALFEQL